MGRNAAGESFLRGFLSYSAADEFWVQVESIEHAQAFAAAVTAMGRSQVVKAVDKNTLAALTQVGTVYYPGPGIGQHAWHRTAFGDGAWSLCGITHTTSSSGAMDAITDLLTAPVQPWDALICTSTAVKENVMRILQAQADYLVHRLGVQKLVLPQMPVIPLGIHTDDFVFTQEQKEAARTALGVDNKTHVVLFMGRLSFHAKAHPLAMYQALELAAKELKKGEKIVLVECGWHANEHIEKAYADAAAMACPSVRVITLDGRKSEERQIAWAGADVFCSLSDNIQETFGIVPIEAMAAGLPVVVSDWDGYKDTVRDGIDGYRIGTLMPQGGLGNDIALRHALGSDNYDMYCGHTCSLVAVDIDAAAQAFRRLFASSKLRKQMGEAGRKRACEVYDWKVIIPQYEALWSELAGIRKEGLKNMQSLAHPWAARMDPFVAFGGYPSSALTPETILSLTDKTVEEAVKRLETYRALAMVNFAKEILPSAAEVISVLTAGADGPKAAIQWIETIEPNRQPFVFRALVWLLKMGIIKVGE